jgi:tripartite-type tricarboxylate transporter receptor subunit TctC
LDEFKKETRMKKSLRSFVLFALAVSLQGTSFSQTTWPDNNVRLVVPYAPGGTTDYAARQIAQKLTEQTGKSFFVENKTGASGTIGTDMVAKSKPDGTTFQVNDTTYAMLPHLFKKLPWDHANDLIPVTTLAVTPLVVVVGTNAPYKSAKEFIDFARKNPGKANYGSGGNGSSTHLGAELLKQSAKLFITHIPYKGAGDAIRGVMSGEVDILVTAAPTAIPAIAGGRVRALMVTSPKRLPALPDVPTTAEVGLKDFNATNWFGLAAPKGTPKPIIDKLQSEVKKALSSPDLVKRFTDQGAEPGGMPVADFQKLVRDETQRWGKLIEAAGVQPE